MKNQQRIAIAAMLLAATLAVGVNIAGDDTKQVGGGTAVKTNLPPVTSAKLTIKDEPQPEGSGISIIRRHMDPVAGELKTEVVFKDGVGTRERNNFGKITKLLYEAKNGSSIERIFVSRDKVITRFKDRNGRLEREVIRESGKSFVVEHLADGTQLTWTPAGPSGKPAVFYEDGKTVRVQVVADGGPTYGPFEVFTRDGKRIYDMTISNNYGDRGWHVRYYRPDGKTVWFEQHWVFPTSEPALRQARDYSETGSLVREVLPSGEVQPDKKADAPMEAKDYKLGAASAPKAVPPAMLEKGRAAPDANAQIPQDDLQRIISRPAPNFFPVKDYLSYILPNEEVLDKLANM
ncbi:MAG: hypothetical protein K2X77_33670 [Candidatus Obscuribacterales bacterium]|jgi:antitoxin component YwqK of YwqJK toxin-antitoxin module|nr:hypothetical protein [Candidatus Obscuribacterales bacterium]